MLARSQLPHVERRECRPFSSWRAFLPSASARSPSEVFAGSAFYISKYSNGTLDWTTTPTQTSVEPIHRARRVRDQVPLAWRWKFGPFDRGPVHWLFLSQTRFKISANGDQDQTLLRPGLGRVADAAGRSRERLLYPSVLPNGAVPDYPTFRLFHLNKLMSVFEQLKDIL